MTPRTAQYVTVGVGYALTAFGFGIAVFGW